MTLALSSALRSKYSHHRPTLPIRAAANAPISAPLIRCRRDRVVPVTTIDSPSAMRMNAWHRSAKWPPSMVQSAVLETAESWRVETDYAADQVNTDRAHPEQFTCVPRLQAAQDGQHPTDHAPGQDALVLPL